MAGPTQKVTITCSAEDLDAKLSKAQKELGLMHDEYGRLTNAQGQFVGGLSQARIKMGDYIDAQGRMRDAQGHYLDGLTAVQQKLRMYRDEMGNLYSAEGELIELSGEYTDELSRQADALAEAEAQERALAQAHQKNSAVLTQSIGQIGQYFSRLKTGNQTIDGAVGALGELTGSVGSAGAAILSAQKSLSDAENAAAAAGKSLSGLTKAVGRLPGILAAVEVGMTTFRMTSKLFADAEEKSGVYIAKNVEQITALSVAYDKLGKSAKNASMEDVVNAGFIAAGGASESDLLAARIKQIEELEAKARDAGKAVINADAKLREANSQHSGGGFIDEYARQFSSNKKEIAEAASKLNQARADSQAAQDALTEAKEGYAEAVAGLVAADLPTDELAQLKERAEIYGKAIEEGTLTGDALANAQKALASVLEQQDEITKKRTDELAREKGFGDFLKEKPKDMLQVWGSVEKAAEELALVYDKESEEYKATMERVKKAFDDRAAKIEEENAKLAAKEKADALGALTSSGFERYLRNTDEELDRFNKTIETWRANAETAGFSTSELETAIQNYTDEFNAKRNEKGISDLGLDKYLKEPELSPLEKYQDVFDKVREAEEKFGLDKGRANQILLAAEQEYANSLQKQAEEEQRKKESRLNELGITGLREKRKTEEDKLLEQQTKIAQAVEEGLISTREANDLNNDLINDYLEKHRGGEEEEETPRQEARPGGANSSMVLGSQSLYQALIAQRDDPYKSEVKQRMTELGKTQENTYTKIESLEAAVTSYLERLQERL